MMTQSVMTQTVNLFGNAPGSVTSKGKQAGSGFELVIDSSLKAGQNATGNTESSTVRKTAAQSSDKDSNSKSDVVNGSDKQTREATKSTSKDVDTEATVPTDKPASKTENTNSTENVTSKDTKELTTEEETLAQIAAMLLSIKETATDILNLSSEELDKLLTDQGLGLVDLLQTENLQQLTLANNGSSTILAVLTDENLADTMNQLQQAVEDIKSEADLGLSMEQIKNLLDTAKQQLEATVNSAFETNLNSMTEVIGKEGQKQETVNTASVEDENSTSTLKNSDQKEIPVDVTKITDGEESSSASQSDSSKSENQDLKATEQYEVFMNNLTKASSNTQVNFNGNLVQVTDVREIANQIVERIRVIIRPEQTSMELQLNPEHLGKVDLSIQSKNGVMTAQFVVQNEISKEAIESQLHTLRETLNQQGIKVEAIEVTVATYSFEQNTNENSDGQAEAKKSHTSNKISLEDAMNMTELSEDVDGTQDITGVRGSQIDYSA